MLVHFPSPELSCLHACDDLLWQVVGQRVTSDNRLSTLSQENTPAESDTYLSEEIGSGSPLWSAAGVLCHSFQTCCCRLALKKTHSQPT
jgi:hypothetical protein